MDILVADPETKYRDELVEILENEEGLNVVGKAGTCQEAIRQVRELQPDLVLLEIQFPDGDGIDLVAEILSICVDTKVVILTTQDSDDQILKAIRSGARGYLLKDSTMTMMLSMLHALSDLNFALSFKLVNTILTNYGEIRADFEHHAKLGRLTPRELEVFQLLCEGASNREIAERLFISGNTVRIHMQSILRKLNIRSRYEAREKFTVALRYHLSRQADSLERVKADGHSHVQ